MQSNTLRGTPPRRGTRLLRGILLIGGAALSAVAASAEDDFTTSRSSFICRSSTEVREIKTYYFADDGRADALRCRVDYIKDGATRTVWSSHTSRAYCDDKAAALAARLNRGSFTCQPLHGQHADPE